MRYNQHLFQSVLLHAFAYSNYMPLHNLWFENCNWDETMSCSLKKVIDLLRFHSVLQQVGTMGRQFHYALYTYSILTLLEMRHNINDNFKTVRTFVKIVNVKTAEERQLFSSTSFLILFVFVSTVIVDFDHFKLQQQN